MSWSRNARVVAVVGILLAAWGCGGSPTAATTTYTQVSSVYAGTLNAGQTPLDLNAYHFAVTNPGPLDVQLSSLAPISTLTMGLRISVWDPTTGTCPAQTSCTICESQAAKVGGFLEVSPPGPGEYCVAIYDVGNLQQNSDYSITVLHY